MRGVARQKNGRQDRWPADRDVTHRGVPRRLSVLLSLPISVLLLLSISVLLSLPIGVLLSLPISVLLSHPISVRRSPTESANRNSAASPRASSLVGAVVVHREKAYAVREEFSWLCVVAVGRKWHRADQRVGKSRSRGGGRSRSRP